MYGQGNLFWLYSYAFILQCFVQNLIENKMWFGCLSCRGRLYTPKLGLRAGVISNKLDTNPILSGLGNAEFPKKTDLLVLLGKGWSLGS